MNPQQLLVDIEAGRLPPPHWTAELLGQVLCAGAFEIGRAEVVRLRLIKIQGEANRLRRAVCEMRCLAGRALDTR